MVLAVSGVTRAEDIKQIRAKGYVLDLGRVLKPDTKTQLKTMCTELAQKTGAQLAIVTVEVLDGNSRSNTHTGASSPVEATARSLVCCNLDGQ